MKKIKCCIITFLFISILPQLYSFGVFSMLDDAKMLGSDEVQLGGGSSIGIMPFYHNTVFAERKGQYDINSAIGYTPLIIPSFNFSHHGRFGFEKKKEFFYSAYLGIFDNPIFMMMMSIPTPNFNLYLGFKKGLIEKNNFNFSIKVFGAIGYPFMYSFDVATGVTMLMGTNKKRINFSFATTLQYGFYLVCGRPMNSVSINAEAVVSINWPSGFILNLSLLVGDNVMFPFAFTVNYSNYDYLLLNTFDITGNPIAQFNISFSKRFDRMGKKDNRINWSE